jgi:hypothetical protein
MRVMWMIIVPFAGAFAHAAPPSDANGKFADWFKSLMVPGIPGAMCCTISDCRMVDARWNDRAQHYEARVIRERFSETLRRPNLSQEENDAIQMAKDAWMRRWIAKFGDHPDMWIEVPDHKINSVQNPTGHPVLCWSVFNGESNGVYCFVPFIAV